MDKLIGRWSYWGGIVCAAIAVLWRAANALSFVPNSFMRTGVDISYWSFLHTGFLLFIVSVASAGYSYISLKKQP